MSDSLPTTTLSIIPWQSKMRVELTGVRRVDRPIPDLHSRPSTGLNGANSAKCNHCGRCSASTQSDEHVAVYNLEQFRPFSKFG